MGWLSQSQGWVMSLVHSPCWKMLESFELGRKTTKENLTTKIMSYWCVAPKTTYIGYVDSFINISRLKNQKLGVSAWKTPLPR